MSIAQIGNRKMTNAEQREKLYSHCEWQKLLRGQRALQYDGGPLAYFRRYGLSSEVLHEIKIASPGYLETNFGSENVELAMKFCQTRFGLVPSWVPKYIHVYEKIRQKYPRFSWVAVVTQDGRRFIRFMSYPYYVCEGVPYYPSLYELVTSLVVVPSEYWKTPIPHKRKVPTPPRRHRANKTHAMY